MPVRSKQLLFALFFISGFCSLVYQVVWLRIAFSSFGVIAPVVSVVVSVFMLGLGLGSWGAGRWIAPAADRTRLSPIWFYGIIELLIGTGALTVPRLFRWGAHALLQSGGMDSGGYLFLSACIIALAMLPWCTCMGATFPCMMAYIKQMGPGHQSSFSYLYLGNVLGAVTGVISTGVFLVELFGFSATLTLAAVLNGFIALTCCFLGLKERANCHGIEQTSLQGPTRVPAATTPVGRIPLILFTTGFASMAMEVVWTRAFTPITKTTIYAFVLLLATYLVGTAEGTMRYRRHLAKDKLISSTTLLSYLAVVSFLPLLINDSRLNPTPLHVLLGLLPLCAGLGYLTPFLIDRYSQGSPDKAGRLYAINIIGSILGPLFAGYILLPTVGVKWALILLALPFTLVFLAEIFRFDSARRVKVGWAAALVAVCVLSCFSWTFEDQSREKGGLVLRDHTATVTAEGQGMGKSLLVNGVGMTLLTPITKIMAHLPLASLQHEPQSILIICFGMGTTYRSAMAWGLNVRAVELVPGVKKAFGYFFDDAPEMIGNPRGRIVIDDGRRYLQRTSEQFDVITLDPPPPIEAAGSSLLYSEEFYELAKTHLQKGGILQQWFPGGEDKTIYAVIGALSRSFPYLRIFHSVEGWGYHLLASMDPIQVPDVEGMLAKLPAKARQDLMEWFPGRTAQEVVADIKQREARIADFQDPRGVATITDSNPYNEYFLLRRWYASLNGKVRFIS